jgi:formylglycine-generating enzyme required for sulfatase activity
MDTARLLRLLDAGDVSAWPDLARDLERRADGEGAAKALGLLHGQDHVEEAAQWLARVTDAPELQTLRAQVLAQSQGWQVGRLRALTKDLLSGDFRLIPAGSFVMGSPEEEFRCDNETQHRVEITQPFLLKTTPVTQAQWQAVMGDNPSYFHGDDPPYFEDDGRRPVESVSWEDASRFCEALSAQTGGVYTLPTEAQWEYACRAETTTALYGDIHAIAWYWQNTDACTHPVAQKQPNAWGLFDMIGNVSEWCLDWFSWNYPRDPQLDPHGPPSGGDRAVRGSSWNDFAEDCRAAMRNYALPTDRSNLVGFRPAGLVR